MERTQNEKQKATNKPNYQMNIITTLKEVVKKIANLNNFGKKYFLF